MENLRDIVAGVGLLALMVGSLATAKIEGGLQDCSREKVECVYHNPIVKYSGKALVGLGFLCLIPAYREERD